jgi:autotransporter adhesin
VAIGTSADATGANSTAIGSDSSATGANATSLGSASTASNTNAIAIGGSASATGTNATALGTSASATKTNALALGTGAQATGTDATAIGSGAIASQDNQFTLGTESSQYYMPGLSPNGAPNKPTSDSSLTYNSGYVFAYRTSNTGTTNYYYDVPSSVSNSNAANYIAAQTNTPVTIASNTSVAWNTTTNSTYYSQSQLQANGWSQAPSGFSAQSPMIGPNGLLYQSPASGNSNSNSIWYVSNSSANAAISNGYAVLLANSTSNSTNCTQTGSSSQLKLGLQQKQPNLVLHERIGRHNTNQKRFSRQLHRRNNRLRCTKPRELDGNSRELTQHHKNVQQQGNSRTERHLLH